MFSLRDVARPDRKFKGTVQILHCVRIVLLLPLYSKGIKHVRNHFVVSGGAPRPRADVCARTPRAGAPRGNHSGYDADIDSISILIVFTSALTIRLSIQLDNVSVIEQPGYLRRSFLHVKGARPRPRPCRRGLPARARPPSAGAHVNRRESPPRRTGRDARIL
ncbi:hypothetical protein EVAR_98319_1 [Eumeta japonica]|uniref:Uncharacterized protein n=1 Tax=Eumeta variegata TaxID=151549 RepID=A0A4C1XB49_EUMVA|nr:hypothetical protein EVAR_98319_1 [Eumeta japonica]